MTCIFNTGCDVVGQYSCLKGPTFPCPKQGHCGRMKKQVPGEDLFLPKGSSGTLENGRKWLDRDFDSWQEVLSLNKSQLQSRAQNVACPSDVSLKSPCKVIVRCRHARSAWERMVRMVVGDPVHLDVVLFKVCTVSFELVQVQLGLIV